MSTRPLKWIVLGPVMALLLLVTCVAREWEDPTAGQPPQMWSRVDYDPKLDDPFFKSKEWSYWTGDQYIDSGMVPEGEVPAKLKHTAKCFSTSFGREHRVRFCEARLLDRNTIGLFIHESNPAFVDRLIVRIRNGTFTSQYWTLFKIRATAESGPIWTTTRQELTLDKKTYNRGCVIKGRIDLECVQEHTDPKWVPYDGAYQTPISVKGLFKAIVE